MENLNAAEKKINIKRMFIMGLTGFFLSLFVVMFISARINFSRSEGIISLILIFIATILFGFWGSRMKKREEIGPVSEEKLSSREKKIIWIFALINPVITGAVLYYMWKWQYPIKARQANKISFIAFLL